MSHKALGVAFEDDNVLGSQFIGATNTGGKLGYAIGLNATVPSVTQATSKATGVTLNYSMGQVVMNNAALAAGAAVKFTVTNSQCALGDVPVIVMASGGTSGDYSLDCTAVAAGSFDVTVQNISAGSLSEAVVVSFALIHAIPLA
jgi:hypothetical protein